MKKKFKRKFNIGTIVFGIIFIYLIIIIIFYMSANTLASYEVGNGKICDFEIYNGIIIRNEQTINAQNEGYPIFLKNEKDKVSVGENIFGLSDQKVVKDGENNEEITEESFDSLINVLDNYRQTYDPIQFEKSYELVNDVQSIIRNTDKLENVDENFVKDIYSAKKDGILSYNIDGKENVKIDDLNKEFFSMNNYFSENMRNKEKIKKEEIICKLIDKEEWKVCIKLTDEVYEKIEKNNINRIRCEFLRDNKEIVADLEIKKQNGINLGILTFKESMIKYIDERYIEIKLIFNEQEGLKIPTTAIVKKDFFKVPTKMLSYGENKTSLGVNKKNILGNGKTDNIFVTIIACKQDLENAVTYIYSNELKKGDILEDEENSQIYELNETNKFEGTYNINKGFLAFKLIEKLYDDGEYAVVKEGTQYGLSNYDFIALNGEKLNDNEIIK